MPYHRRNSISMACGPWARAASSMMWLHPARGAVRTGDDHQPGERQRHGAGYCQRPSFRAGRICLLPLIRQRPSERPWRGERCCRHQPLGRLDARLAVRWSRTAATAARAAQRAFSATPTPGRSATASTGAAIPGQAPRAVSDRQVEPVDASCRACEERALF